MSGGFKQIIYLTEYFLLNLHFILQVKLFREWNPKWPDDFKLKLKEKVTELDPPYGERVKEEILNAFSPENGNGIATNGDSPSPVIPNEPIAPQN